ncbi:leucine-rich repeat-domain-containing protein, partial [Ochromonadaceae sp. CCMP2298]
LGLKLPALENLAVLQDAFDCLDLCDNDLRKLDGFPLSPPMRRLNTLLLANNHISRVGELGLALPGLRSLLLSNNKIANLSEILLLSALSLHHLSLLDNPVCLKPHYRLYTIHTIPSLKWLDFKKVQQKEREEAAAFFKSAAGGGLSQAVLAEAKVIAEGGAVAGAAGVVLTAEQKVLVKKAIERATTKNEIDLIEKSLKTGNLAYLAALLADPPAAPLAPPAPTLSIPAEAEAGAEGEGEEIVGIEVEGAEVAEVEGGEVEVEAEADGADGESMDV